MNFFKTGLLVGAVLAMAATAWAGVRPVDDKVPDLSGTWKADVAKSDFGPFGGPDSQTSVFDHKEPKIKVKTSTKGGPQGDQDIEANYMTDGTESTNHMGEMEVKSTAKWQGKKLVISSKLNVQGMDIVATATYELAEDGKSMTVSTVINTPQGDFNTKVLFNKSE